jgi:hypothetical protein
VIDVPADPMPIRVKLRVQFTNYLNGELGGELDSLLAPGVPVLDTVSTCNETYCVRAAIVQTLNMSNTLITSDTVCLSDRCGASQDRLKSPTTLAPATRTKRIPPPVAGPEATMRSFVRPDSTGIRPSLRPPVHP